MDQKTPSAVPVTTTDAIPTITTSTTTSSFVSYQLLPASQSDGLKVQQAYQLAPVPGYDIATIHYIQNPALADRYTAQVKLLQARQGKIFDPQWESQTTDTDEERDWRKTIMAEWKTTKTGAYAKSDYPSVQFALTFHGTRQEYLDSICSAGFVVLAKTDPGFFGKGVYSTLHAAYAYGNYSDGTLIVNEVALRSPYPVIHKDMEKLYGVSYFENYDGGCIPVVSANPSNPAEVNYYATMPYQTAAFWEVLVSDASQCSPNYVVQLQPNGLKTSVPKDKEVDEVGFLYYQQGHQHELDGNVQAALVDFLKAAQLGYAPAYIRVVDCAESWGLTMQPQKYLIQVEQSLNWLIQSKNFPSACYALGRCYELGLGMQTNFVKAVECYQLAIDKHDDLLSYYRLAWCYEKGIGVQKNLKQAVKCYQVCAQRGYAPALSQLGYCYQEGLGVEVSISQAFAVYQQAANKGHAGAQANLALFYEKGIFVQPNLSEAIRYYQKAAAQGQVNAQFTLGHLYGNGFGVTRNLIQAKYYYNLAAAQGHALAKAQWDELMEKLQSSGGVFQVANGSSGPTGYTNNSWSCVLQ